MRFLTLAAPVAGLALALSCQSAWAQEVDAPTSSTTDAPPTATAPAATASSTAIPSGISDQCNRFLTALNSDATIKSCTGPLQSAVQYYTNSTSSAAPASSDALTSSLDRLCAPDAGCSQAALKTNINNFFTQCNAEMKALNQDVIKIYDMLYLINPFRDAVCAKQDGGNYCLTNIAAYASSQNNPTPSSKRSLAPRQDAGIAGVASADGSVASTNVAFLFLKPSDDKSVLCSDCTKKILASYINFETAIPYAIGLSNSVYLKGQSDLYKSSQASCGKSFSTSVNELAGTTAFAHADGALSLVATAPRLLLSVVAVIGALLAM